MLQRINIGLSHVEWERYQELIGKRRAETLTPEEQEALIELSDRIEAADAERIARLVELARFRHV